MPALLQPESWAIGIKMGHSRRSKAPLGKESSQIELGLGLDEPAGTAPGFLLSAGPLSCHCPAIGAGGY
jgi:hypothetical protein